MECGRSFFSQRDIAKMRRRPDVDTHKFPSSHRKQLGATVILSSHVDPVDLHVAQFWYSFNSWRCLGKQPARHWRAPWRNLCSKKGLRHICVEFCLRTTTSLARDCVPVKFSRSEWFLVVFDSSARPCDSWLMGPDLLVTNKKD